MLAVKDASGINIRVERPLHTRFKEHYFEFEMDRTMDRYEFEVFLIEEKSLSLRHPSETSLDNYEDWDYVINNNTSIADLLAIVRVIYNKEIKQ